MAGYEPPLKMSDQKRICRLVLPIAILALVIGTTFGEVWHRHISSSPETCPICHMSNLAVELPLSNVRPFLLVPAVYRLEPQRFSFHSRPAILRIPARAPPA
jgi:hypothetical protein